MFFFQFLQQQFNLTPTWSTDSTTATWVLTLFVAPWLVLAALMSAHYTIRFTMRYARRIPRALINWRIRRV